ncbi:MAG: hypothetical protein IJ282_07765 [Lachnospiraceae bacterium]|nr:hypothetical protein [Lachnospiraceae bacterium]
MTKRGKTAFCLWLSFLLAGCSGAGDGQQVIAESIELIEPVNTAQEYEEAAYRNLYEVEIYSASVMPYVVEYAFESDQKFMGYGALPGEKVKKDETLVYSDSESIDKKIETMEERLVTMKEDYDTYKQELEEEWAQSKSTLDYYEWGMDAYADAEPKPYVADETVSGGDAAGYAAWEQEYAKWQKEYRKWEGDYRKLAHAIDTQEKALEQRTQLYELDYAYYEKQLERLKEQKKDGSIIAGMSGEIVAISDLSYGSTVSKETPVVAVGNPDTKVLKCNYINSMIVSKAQEMYAMIDGVRYEVEHQTISAEEYTELTTRGETVYSTFHLIDAGDEVGVGDFAVIVVVLDKREQVLSVPKEAIHKDEGGNYVYVLGEEGSQCTYVSTGMSDGAYTEIESGLNSGQKVLLTAGRQPGSNVATVKMGSFCSEFSGSGYMYYPSSMMVQSPVEYGTVYFGEMLVSQYQHVEKGDVIATIRVQENEIEMQRQETRLQRLEERLQDYLEQHKDSDSEAVTEEIASRQEIIAEQKELLENMKADAETVEIKSDRTGVIIWVADYEKEDILSAKANIIRVADEDTCYVIVENTNQLLNYGNKVTITYEDREGKEKTASGMVSTISAAGVTSAMNTEYSMILLPADVISDMAVATQGQGGWWNRNRYGVSADIREMNQVLVVPRKAVTEIAGNTYVHIIDENGNVVAQSFVAGGYDNQNYWVIEGLSEGMNVCLE